MKIREIEKLCKKSKQIILTMDENCQWLGDGTAVYRMYGMPRIDKNTVFPLLDIPSAEADIYSFREFSSITEVAGDNLAEYDPAAQKAFRTLSVEDREMVLTSYGAVSIDARYLKPLSDVSDVELYEIKIADGSPALAMNAGMILLGILRPAVHLDNSMLYKKITELHSAMIETAAKYDYLKTN